LCINSYLNFVQNRTGPISDGYADITKCTRDDFVRFTKRIDTLEIDYIEYNEKEAIESKARGHQILNFMVIYYRHVVCYQPYNYHVYMVPLLHAIQLQSRIIIN